MKLNKLTTLVLTGAILSTMFLVGCAPKEGETDATGTTATPTADNKTATPETTTPPEAK